MNSVKITNETIDRIENLSEKHKIKVLWDFDSEAKFQGRIIDRERRIIVLKGIIDPDDFDRLFKQISQKFAVEHNQEMFLFNFFHEVGHFELDLFPDAEDYTVRRMQNLSQDKEVNKWAYERLQELRKSQSRT